MEAVESYKEGFLTSPTPLWIISVHKKIQVERAKRQKKNKNYICFVDVSQLKEKCLKVFLL